MDAERRAQVEAVVDGHARLRLAGGCTDCGGCGGRCRLLGTSPDAASIELPLARFDCPPSAGQAVRVYLPAAELLAQARRGYGLPLAGLLLGALAGHLFALSLNHAPDSWAVLAAATGTLAGMRASKRSSPPACRVAPDRAAAAFPPTACNEDASQ